jgi:hypothetical protein
MRIPRLIKTLALLICLALPAAAGAGDISATDKYAWSETAGWKNFAPTGGGVTSDPVSGLFDGYAWGESGGWISFRSASGAAVSYGVGLFSYQLTLTLSGNGTGWVVSLSPPFSCNTGCVQRFVDSAPLTLTAHESEYSLPGVWSVCDGAAGTECNLTMNSDRSVEVTFTRDSAYTARIYGTPPTYFTTLQKAYDKAVTANAIEVWGIELGAGLACGSDADVTIRGGYDQPYLNQTGMTTLSGLTISRGKVTVDGIVVK